MNGEGATTAARAADLIFTGCTVLRNAHSRTLEERMDVVVADGRIVAAGYEAGKMFSAAHRIAAGDLLVMPGFVNAHTHSGETLRRGVSAQDSLDRWVSAVWGEVDRLSPHEIEVAVLLGASEMLKRGIVHVLDHFRQLPMRPEAVAAASAAYARSGLRATLAIMLRDRDETGAPQAARSWPSARDQIDLASGALATKVARERQVALALGPSAPLRCSDELLEAAAQWTLDHGALLHMHVDETADQAARARRLYGCSSVRHLDAIGLLGPNLSIAHAVWIDDDDIARLGARGVSVVHNPASNMRLGSGRAPIGAMQRAGINVALGTDGAASNDSQDILEAAKLAVLLSRIGASAGQADWIAPADALQMAIDGGRRALWSPDGEIAPGREADLIAVELDSSPLVPLNDMGAQLVLGGPAIRVRHVVVGGSLALRDGQLTGLDEIALYAEARALSSLRGERRQ